MMDRLLGKIGMPSYLPTPAEVLEGVRWLRENPALAASVVVGLTSYSVAKYYEYEGDSDEEEINERDELSLNSLSITDSQLDMALGGHRATQEEIARSVSAIQLGLLKVRSRGAADRASATDSTASTQSSSGGDSFSGGGGLRSRASSVFDRALLENAMDSESEAEEREKKPTCMHGDECPPDRPCCDPDWGWFVSTARGKAKATTKEQAAAAATASDATAVNAVEAAP